MQAEAARRAGRDHRLRLLIGDVVGAATRWANTAEILILSTSGDRWTKRDWVEWASRDSGREMGANAQAMEDHARSIRLLTDDPIFLTPLAKAKEVIGDGAVFEGLHDAGPSSGESRSQAYARLRAVRTLFSDLEQAAASALSG